MFGLAQGDGYFSLVPLAVSTSELFAPRFFDLDRDGHLDIVSTLDGGAAWLPHIEGTRTFGEARITPNPLADSAQSIATGDLDGDGDPDLVVGSLYGDTLAWYENAPHELVEVTPKWLGVKKIGHFGWFRHASLRAGRATAADRSGNFGFGQF